MERIHIDYAGSFLEKMFQVMIDAYSKWTEVHPINTATSRVIIEKLRSTFAIHGLPMTIVSDKGSNFCSEEFEEFLAKNGIHHRKTAPYHPASNGLAESRRHSLRTSRNWAELFLVICDYGKVQEFYDTSTTRR